MGNNKEIITSDSLKQLLEEFGQKNKQFNDLFKNRKTQELVQFLIKYKGDGYLVNRFIDLIDKYNNDIENNNTNNNNLFKQEKLEETVDSLNYIQEVYCAVLEAENKSSQAVKFYLATILCLNNKDLDLNLLNTFVSNQIISHNLPQVLDVKSMKLFYKEVNNNEIKKYLQNKTIEPSLEQMFLVYVSEKREVRLNFRYFYNYDLNIEKNIQEYLKKIEVMKTIIEKNNLSYNISKNTNNNTKSLNVINKI